MTTEIDKIGAGVWMDRIVHEKVCRREDHLDNIDLVAPEFSTSIGIAWKMLHRFKREGCWAIVMMHGDGYQVSIHWPDGGCVIGYADTAPLAICRAALKAAEVANV